MKVAFYTLGCKVNQYDTQTMMEQFRQNEYEIVSFHDKADIYVVNTCTVTAMSDHKSRQIVTRAHTHNPDAVICVTGCLAQRAADEALALPGVQMVIGNQERGKIVQLLEELMQSKVQQKTINAVKPIKEANRFEDLPAMMEGRTRAVLKIQEGCNRFCTFCIIPYARGPLRSRTVEGIKKEVHRLVEQGFSEFVLTGIHIASYQGENGERLEDVLQELIEISGVQRIRLGSLEPNVLTDKFIAVCAENDKICRHFHVSLQSGSNSVLKRMNRHYSVEHYAYFVSNLRKEIPQAAITTDIIAGFPGEIEEEHRETMDFVRDISFSRLHVFPFSPRTGTPAAKMPNQIPKSVKSRRTHELIELGRECEARYFEEALGSVQQVLFERRRPDGLYSGYTDTYILTCVQSTEEDLQGQIRSVILNKKESDCIYGSIKAN